MRLFVLLIAALSGALLPAMGGPSEDTRVNLTRVMIEKARLIGRDHPVGTMTDGYEAVKSMVWTELLKDESDQGRQQRIFWITDFAQGFCELERNSAMKGKELAYELRLGTQGELKGLVIVRFIYPKRVLPPDAGFIGFEWRLLWQREASAKDREVWRLERLTRLLVN